MILQINTEYAWVEFKPPKDKMPDSSLIYGGLNLAQFHSDGMHVASVICLSAMHS